MIVYTSNRTNEFISAEHRDGDIYQIQLTHQAIAELTMEFSEDEIVDIINGLTVMVEEKRKIKQS